MGAALLLLPDFLLIAGGAALRRMPGFGAPFWSGVERLVYYVLFPALLFRALATSPLGLGDAGRLTAIGVGFTVAGMALSLAAGPLFRLPRATFASCFQCAFRFNTYVALAVGTRLGGDAGVAAMSLLIGVLVPLVNFAAVTMLARGRDAHVGIELAKNPLVVACVAGIAWKLAGWPVPELAARVLGHLASAALPLGLLAVGAGLRLAQGTLSLPALAWWNGIKLVALPACALVLAEALGATALERQIAVGMAAVPTATSAYILATQMDGDGPSVAALISSGTLLAALTLPLWLALVT